MRHNPDVPQELRDPGITDAQCFGSLALSALTGLLVGCWGGKMAALVAFEVVLVVCVVALWVHRRRRLIASYHAQRRRNR